MFCSYYFKNAWPTHVSSYVMWDSKSPDFVLSLFLIFLSFFQGFCSHKIALTKKVNIHNGKRKLFSESSVLENSFHVQSE